jgi:PAS domain S-box-containing protein
MDANPTHATAPPAPELNERAADLYARFQEAFEFAPDPQFVTDNLGVILEANLAAAALTGHRKVFLVGKPLPLLAAEGSRAQFYRCLWQLSHQVRTDAFESWLARRGADPRQISVTARSGGLGAEPHATSTIHWAVRDITEWRHAETARAELQRRLTTAQEDERRRIARDLHDTTGQLLTALALGVRAVRDAGQLPPAALTRLDQLQRLTDELARQVHELAAQLRPAALDDLGLEAAVRQLVETWSARTGIAADFQLSGAIDRRFPPEIETVLFRIVQEALTNVAKHAGASHVAVVIGRSDVHAIAIVEDDGGGFDPENVNHTPPPGRPGRGPTRLGLLGMRERVDLVGGTLEIETAPGRGTTIIARLPVSEPAPR